jgi:altronate dehydratase
VSEKLQAIIIDAGDNVATAVADLKGGQAVRTRRAEVFLLEDIPFGHKFALVHIPRGGFVIKYGTPVGRATSAIETGCLVHVHNVEDMGRTLSTHGRGFTP